MAAIDSVCFDAKKTSSFLPFFSTPPPHTPPPSSSVIRALSSSEKAQPQPYVAASACINCPICKLPLENESDAQPVHFYGSRRGIEDLAHCCVYFWEVVFMYSWVRVHIFHFEERERPLSERALGMRGKGKRNGTQRSTKERGKKKKKDGRSSHI